MNPLKKDISETNPSNAEWANVSELDKFFDNDSIKANQEIIESVLNKAENKSLKEWFENFLLNEENTIKKNAIKLKLSKATDELTVKSIIAEVVEWWYKVWDKKNVWEDRLEWENVKEWESIWGENLAEKQNWNLEDALQQVEEKKEQARIDTEQARTDTEQARTDTEQVNTLKEEVPWLAELNTAIEERDRLIDKYKNLNSVTNNNTEKYQAVKSQLENNWTLNQLRKSNHDEQFINNYILVQTTLTELKSNPTNYEQSDISNFDKIVKNLNNSCNIPDTNLNSFSSENISQTRTELFHSEVWNDGLIQARDKNLESRDYANIFPEMRDEDLIAKYGNFLEWDLKIFCQNYTNNTNGLKNKIEEISKKEEFNLTEEEKKLFDEYKNMLAELGKKREEIEDQTKNMMEELCIISQIKWMYMCIWEWADFNLNKANEIRYDKEWAMILDGHIDGIDFSIRQDVSNPEAKLQTSQKLIKNGNAFEVGWKDKFVDSNFILPSQNEIFDSISEIVKTDSSLVDFDNQSDYLENLQSNIMWKMEEKYKDTKLVHHYMKEQVKWQKIVNKALWLVERIDSSITDNEELMKNINKDANRKLYTFMKVLKYNIDNSTDIEKDHFDWCIDEIWRVISNYKANKKISGIYSDEISKCLENDIWIHWTQEQGLNLIFDLFNHFNENPISDGRSGLEWDDWIPSNMIINDLYLQLHDKPIAKKEQLKRNEISNADHETADEVLKSWPSEPPVYVA